MPHTTEDFYARALAHADAEGRLPLPDQSLWEIFPFEPDSLRSKPLDPPVLPEPPRNGEEGGRPCWRCTNPDEGVVWSDERWVLTSAGETGLPFAAMLMPKQHLDLGDLDEQHAAEMGVLIVRVERAVRALGGIGRVHVYKFGDGGAHLHVFLLARPAGLLQLRGSCLTLWDDMLPRTPADVLDADLRTVARALATQGGEARA